MFVIELVTSKSLKENFRADYIFLFEVQLEIANTAISDLKEQYHFIKIILIVDKCTND